MFSDLGILTQEWKNKKEKKMDNETETGNIWWIIRTIVF